MKLTLDAPFYSAPSECLVHNFPGRGCDTLVTSLAESLSLFLYVARQYLRNICQYIRHNPPDLNARALETLFLEARTRNNPDVNGQWQVQSLEEERSSVNVRAVTGQEILYMFDSPCLHR